MTFGEQVEEGEAHNMLSLAVEKGVELVDTSEVYPIVPRLATGKSSRILGNWLSKRGCRSSIRIATKVCGRSSILDWIPSSRISPLKALEAGQVLQQPRVDKKSIRAAAEAEMIRLRTDYIDLFQIHWPDRSLPMFEKFQFRPEHMESPDSVPFEEQVEAMGDLIREGKVLTWGLSNETSYGVMSMVAAARSLGIPLPVTIQNNYSLLQRTFEGDLAEACCRNNIKLLPWSGLAGGALTGKYLNGDLPAGSRFDLFETRYKRFNSHRVNRAVRAYTDLAYQSGLTCLELSLGFLRSKWFVSETLLGATSVQQLAENIKCFEDEPLSEDVLAKIEEIHNDQRNPALED